MSKSVIVSYASQGREDYRAGVLKLIESAKGNWDGDMFVYSPDHYYDSYLGVPIIREMPKDMLPHSEMPYQFKYSIIKQMREMGYERVVWLDSCVRVCKDITPLFSYKYGITTFHNLGHRLDKYITDEALLLLDEYDIEEIKKIPQIWGGVHFWDFTNVNAQKQFDLIWQYANNGSFKNGTSKRPDFVGHRHDQAVLSVLLCDNCDMRPYGDIVYTPHHRTFEYGKDFYLKCVTPTE